MTRRPRRSDIEADGIECQGRDQVEAGVDEDGLRQRGAEVAGAQDEEGIGRIAEAEQGAGGQVAQVRRREAGQGGVERPLGVLAVLLLGDQEDHQHGEKSRDHRQDEDRAVGAGPQGQDQDGDQRTEEGAGVVAHALQAEGLAAVGLVGRAGDQGVPRGAVRTPVPNRSRKRAPKHHIGQTGARPISGLAEAATR